MFTFTSFTFFLRLLFVAGSIFCTRGIGQAEEKNNSESSPWLIEDSTQDQVLPGANKLSTPYVPLMAVVGGGSLGPFSDEQVSQIATTWSMVNGHGGMALTSDPAGPLSGYWAGPSSGVDAKGRTIGQRIKAVNPHFTLSNYRNGSYVSQNTPHEAEEVESRFPLAISVWNTNATLRKEIDAQATIIELSLAAPIDRPKGQLPREGRPEFYPFVASSTPANYSLSTKEYVAWLRIGDEILRIEKITKTGEGLSLRVRRGLWSTTAQPHVAGSSIFQPVYIGRNSGIDAGDNSLGGRPGDTAKQRGLRYALVTADSKMQIWLAEKAAAIFSEGYDVCWLDVSVSTWYNNANAYGDEVHPWNLAKNQLLTQDDYREWQQKKNDALYARFPHGKFWINNVKGAVYFEDGRDRNQLSGENNHHAVDGASMEMYANNRGNLVAWRQTADMTLDMVNSGFRSVAWSKGADLRGYRVFSYATFLLAYRPGSNLLFAIGEGGGLLKKPPALFYYDLGQPKQNFRRVAEAEITGTAGVYARNFTHGKILVNPGTDAHTIVLDQSYLNAASGASIKELTLAGTTGAILLLPSPQP